MLLYFSYFLLLLFCPSIVSLITRYHLHEESKTWAAVAGFMPIILVSNRNQIASPVRSQSIVTFSFRILMSNNVSSIVFSFLRKK